MNKIRTRFAPSPTGYLHIGGARTCLFNWLFSRANKGDFILRIEDTDKVRSKQEYLDEIFDSLKWLGMDWDEVYYQSKRFDLCIELANKLIKEDKAYKAEDGSGAIILKMPQKSIKINDLVHGEIQFDTSTIKDQVLMKSDGTPTYNFACVVDDADLKISHVIRGDDHISNTPKQIVIYEALGFSLPEFAHIPMILSSGGGRLSKRTGATAISEYRNMGFLSEAIVNYLSLLGWSPGDDQEIISKEESIKKFSIKDINDTAAAFDLDKLKWINGTYLRKMPSEKILEMIIPLFMEKKFIQEGDFDRNWLLDLIKLFQERINTISEIVDKTEFLFVNNINFNDKARAKLQERDLIKEFVILHDRFFELQEFDHSAIEKAFRQAVEELKIKTKVLIHPLRAAITGTLEGPGLFDVIALLGKDKTCQRLNRVIENMKEDKGRTND